MNDAYECAILLYTVHITKIVREREKDRQKKAHILIHTHSLYHKNVHLIYTTYTHRDNNQLLGLKLTERYNNNVVLIF